MWIWIACGVLSFGIGLYRISDIRHFGSIEGVLRINGVAAPKGHTITCQYVITDKPDGAFSLPGIQRRTKTKSGGRFRFLGVPAEEVALGRLRRDGDTLLRPDDIHPDVEQLVQVTAWKTVQVNLGESNVCIVGKLCFPDDLPRENWMEKRTFWLKRQGRLLHDSQGKPIPGLEKLTKDTESDPLSDSIRCWYHLPVQADGRFEVTGVRPGMYGLSVSNGTWGNDFVDFPMGHCGIGFKLIEVHDDVEKVNQIDVGDIVVARPLLEIESPGSLEGVLYKDGALAPRNTKVFCRVDCEWEDDFDDPKWNRGGMRNLCDEATRTDSNGRFFFKDLPVGMACISEGNSGDFGDYCEDDEDSDDIAEDTRKVAILPGQTTHVVLEEKGIPKPA